jgi:hypothetical protein
MEIKTLQSGNLSTHRCRFLNCTESELPNNHPEFHRACGTEANWGSSSKLITHRISIAQRSAREITHMEAFAEISQRVIREIGAKDN